MGDVLYGFARGVSVPTRLLLLLSTMGLLVLCVHSTYSAGEVITVEMQISRTRTVADHECVTGSAPCPVVPLQL